MLYTFFICFVAGIGAGLGTGFAGMSAAAVISPMLITFLDLPAYQAVGSPWPATCSPARSALISITKTKTWTLKTAL